MTIISYMVLLGYRAQQNFFSFGPFIALLLKNQNAEKMKKTPEDIIILQMCTINGRVTQWVRALELESEGSQFKPH